MAQVVTNENIQEFIQKGEVAEFVKPADPKPEVKADTAEPKTVAPDEKPAQARNEEGKFVAAEPAPDKTEPQTAAQPAGDDEDDLPERVKRIIGKKHREMKEAQEFARERDRDAAVALAEAERLRQELSKKSGPQQEKSGDAPKPEDFKTVAEYIDASVEHGVTKKLATLKQEFEQTQRQSASNQLQSEFEVRVNKIRDEIPDYDDVIAAAVASKVTVPAHLSQFVVESEKGPRLAYELAKPENREKLQQLVKLSPVRALAELGKMEAALEVKPVEKAPPAASKAPSPIVPIAATQTVVETDPSKMSFQQLREYRKQERAAGKYKW